MNVVGGQQQALQQAADTAQYNQYLAQLQYPQTMLTLQKSIMAGLPQGTQTTYNATPSTFQNILSASGGVAAMTKNLTDMGLTKDAISKFLSQNFASTASATGTFPLEGGGEITINPDGTQYIKNADGVGTYYDANGNPQTGGNNYDGTPVNPDVPVIDPSYPVDPTTGQTDYSGINWGEG